MTGRTVPENLKTLEAYVLDDGVFGNSENSLASKQREHRDSSYFFHHVFMSRKLLSTEYPELKERTYLLPICQVKRWMRLLNPQKRKQVTGEIKRIQAMNPHTIDSRDRLLTSLAL